MNEVGSGWQSLWEAFCSPSRPVPWPLPMLPKHMVLRLIRISTMQIPGLHPYKIQERSVVAGFYVPHHLVIITPMKAGSPPVHPGPRGQCREGRV